MKGNLGIAMKMTPPFHHMDLQIVPPYIICHFLPILSILNGTFIKSEPSSSNLLLYIVAELEENRYETPWESLHGKGKHTIMN
jgi:hypothetical protein